VKSCLVVQGQIHLFTVMDRLASAVDAMHVVHQ
jgi:hypothetical protein